jgi:hypothetical protein
MRKKISLLVIVYCLFFINGSLYAQSVTPQVINTSAGTATINNIRLDWNVGELPLVVTMQNVIVLTNGFLQPFAGSEVNNNTSFSPEEIRVFPNPASSFVEINFLTIQKGTISIRLYNSMGQLVFQNLVAGNGIAHTERIDMEKLSATEYFLQIVLDPAPGSISKKGSYKIIKMR